MAITNTTDTKGEITLVVNILGKSGSVTKKHNCWIPASLTDSQAFARQVLDGKMIFYKAKSIDGNFINGKLTVSTDTSFVALSGKDDITGKLSGQFGIYVDDDKFDEVKLKDALDNLTFNGVEIDITKIKPTPSRNFQF